jgi:hypothetical protein
MLDEIFNIAKEQADYENINYEVRDDYSGRCMYGITTKGLVVDTFAEAKYLDERVAIELAKKEYLEDYGEYLEEDDDTILSDLKAQECYPERGNEFQYFNTDSMGLSIIIY